LALLATGVLDEDTSHGLRGGGEEVAAVIKVLIADEPQVRLVDQGRGLKRLRATARDNAGANGARSL
jgi:hypothetical protein